MNYDRIYLRLISRAKSQNRKKLKRTDPNHVYYEVHHIIPQCIMPIFSDLKKFPWNGVLLTAREHYMVHQLLVKMKFYKDDLNFYGIIKAAIMMASTCNIKGNSRKYEWLKIQLSNKKIPEATKNKMSASKTGCVFSEEHKINLRKNSYWKGKDGCMKDKSHTKDTKKKMSDSKKGKSLTHQHRKNIGDSNKGKIISETQKKQISCKNSGKKFTDEHKKKLSDVKLGKKRSLEIRQHLSKVFVERWKSIEFKNNQKIKQKRAWLKRKFKIVSIYL